MWIAKKYPGPERNFQWACEKYLKLRGYWPRDNRSILCPDNPPRGFYLHVHRAQANPLVLDLLIVDNAWRALEVELKCEKGKVSDVQKVLLERGGCLVWNLDEFMALLAKWEAAAPEKRQSVVEVESEQIYKVTVTKLSEWREP